MLSSLSLLQMSLLETVVRLLCNYPQTVRASSCFSRGTHQSSSVPHGTEQEAVLAKGLHTSPGGMELGGTGQLQRQGGTGQAMNPAAG